MRIPVRSPALLFAVTLFVGAIAPRAALAQAGGAIEGTITDAGSGRPLLGARVSVTGTQLGATTGDRGVFRITGVPARQVEIRVRMLGYSPAGKTVVVADGQTVRADFPLQLAALQLEQVVVTGSGQQTEVKRLGNTVAVIQPPEDAPIQ